MNYLDYVSPNKLRAIADIFDEYSGRLCFIKDKLYPILSTSLTPSGFLISTIDSLNNEHVISEAGYLKSFILVKPNSNTITNTNIAIPIDQKIVELELKPDIISEYIKLGWIIFQIIPINQTIGLVILNKY